MRNWWQAVLSGEIVLHLNPCKALLMEKAIQKRQAILTNHGALIKKCEKKFTPNVTPLYFVPPLNAPIRSPEGLHHLEMNNEEYEDFKNQFLKKIHFLKEEIFLLKRDAGTLSHSLSVHFLTTSPIHALLFDLLIKNKSESSHKVDFIIFHDSTPISKNPKVDVEYSSFCAVNFLLREALIVGVDSLEVLQVKILEILRLIYFQEEDRGPSFFTSPANLLLNKENFFGSLMENIPWDEKTRKPIGEIC